MDLDPSSPIVGVVAAIGAGVSLLIVSRYARRLGEPARGLLRLSLGEVSFTEIFGMFLLAYGIGALLVGPRGLATPSGPPRVPVGGRFFGSPFSPLARAGLPLVAGTVVGLITFLYRFDLVGKMTNPPSHRAVAAIIGAEARAVENIPAGGHGQITFRDPTGNLVGIMAAADVDVPRGSRVRIVGTKGLNPLVALESETDYAMRNTTGASPQSRSSR
jgi:membrane protein implicated in regulation of membrane protease activity